MSQIEATGVESSSVGGNAWAWSSPWSSAHWYQDCGGYAWDGSGGLRRCYLPCTPARCLLPTCSHRTLLSFESISRGRAGARTEVGSRCVSWIATVPFLLGRFVLCPLLPASRHNKAPTRASGPIMKMRLLIGWVANCRCSSGFTWLDLSVYCAIQPTRSTACNSTGRSRVPAVRWNGIGLCSIEAQIHAELLVRTAFPGPLRGAGAEIEPLGLLAVCRAWVNPTHRRDFDCCPVRGPSLHRRRWEDH